MLIGTPIFALGMWFLLMPPFEFSDVTVFGQTASKRVLTPISQEILFTNLIWVVDISAINDSS